MPSSHSKESTEAFFQNTANLRQRAQARADFHRDEVDVYTEIARNFRQLRLQTADTITTLLTWSWHHPFMMISTISVLGGILWFMLRTRSIVGPMARTITPQDVAGLIHYFMPINNNNYNRQDEQQVAQRNLFMMQ